MPTIQKKSRTYIPTDDHQISEFLRQFETQFRFAAAAPTLSDGNGQVIALPDQLFEVLRQVAEYLADGRGVTVIPQETRLTTQEAADYLGISRPTMIKILESGVLAYEKIGRHRRVMLRDLVEYRDLSRAERRSTLQQMARAGQEAGVLNLSYERDAPE